MKASIGDVALKAGVSNATVSRTFAHPEQVSEATRIKVQAAADALNFSISRSAGILKSGRTYRVALLIGSHAIEWFTAEIIAGLNDVLRDAGYDLVIYPIRRGRGTRCILRRAARPQQRRCRVLILFRHQPRRSKASRHRQKYRLSESTPPARASMRLLASTTRKALSSSCGILPN